jgi:hypothetical protein
MEGRLCPACLIFSRVSVPYQEICETLTFSSAQTARYIYLLQRTAVEQVDLVR